MALMQLEEHQATAFKWRTPATWPVLMLGFRALFLLAGIFAVVSVSIWAFILNGGLVWTHPYPATYWHAHEMLFGFAGAVVAGFLLTAAKNWTQRQTLHGASLLLLCGIWLAARLSFFVPHSSLLFTLLLQLGFWLMVLVNLTKVILDANSNNNRVFIFALGILCSCNTVFLLLLHSQQFQLVSAISQASLVAYMLLIGVVGGRVIPFFIARGLQQPQKPRTPKLDRVIFYLAVINVVAYVVHASQQTSYFLSTTLFILGLFHCVRAMYWFDYKLFSIPLLWSLYLSYCAISVGLLLNAYNISFAPEHLRSHLHLVAITGMGLMILAMMARVTLGHTGRRLQIGTLTTLAFICIATSGLIRALLIHFMNPHLAWLSSAVAWIIGFMLFLISFAPMLMQKRIDGRMG
ncbi:NnrS family protein [Pseudoalteromonas piscicida]|uniref:NnrS family protein n=1 Tax=Pseudoalteromonas piscicida TaxID=43662 RepID=UPI003099288A